jgi:hypothetical protein
MQLGKMKSGLVFDSSLTRYAVRSNHFAMISTIGTLFYLQISLMFTGKPLLVTSTHPLKHFLFS